MGEITERIDQIEGVISTLSDLLQEVGAHLTVAKAHAAILSKIEQEDDKQLAPLYCWELVTKNETFYCDGEFEAASDEEAMDKAKDQSADLSSDAKLNLFRIHRDTAGMKAFKRRQPKLFASLVGSELLQTGGQQ